MSVIVVVREWAWADSLRSYIVVIDGNRVASVRAGDERSVPVPPGAHEVVLRCGLITRSRPLTVEVEAEGEVRLRCRSALGVNNVLAMLKPWSYIELSQL
jgi:hypothetical protein